MVRLPCGSLCVSHGFNRLKSCRVVVFKSALSFLGIPLRYRGKRRLYANCQKF
ncbi:hypothetical protein HMPREF0294_2430 [Corynebacterium glucuronolyticum ATCC 51867]|uniref:Uncharacterized protein n=1 Tax=Corynebacterium glucuronolyticum ATCC 51866 TaxID=548478 RepID=A0ABM9XT48_9CORY|nr:hypothetical protein HMPREF0294_2430 [Corynebacterium glucuronolyticum ATCC 51867]EEI64374.1 hypothetical protein HMPREF0293_0189 [Corynebacterium glucuronolyticum ATCC 51866]